MLKRLRKKKRIGEFQEFGVEISVTLHPDADYDDFLCDAVEDHGLAFGGGGKAPHLKGFVELGRREVHLSNLGKIEAWLTADSRVRVFERGEPADAWA